MPPRSCTVCGSPLPADRDVAVPFRTGRCIDCVGVHVAVNSGSATASARRASATVHPTLPFSQDIEAQRFVDEHPGGANFEEVGRAFGLTRERIRQIETRALTRLVKRLALLGVKVRADLSIAADDDLDSAAGDLGDADDEPRAAAFA